MGKIKGGYYLKARCIQNSRISTMPPYVREIWDWLLKEANHSEKKTEGITIQRGQLIRTFKDIQKGLHWMIGYRKMTYKKWQCEKSMKFLREQGMVVTTKATRGIFITICNYDYYQTSKNYESNKRATARVTREQQLASTINKNDKNNKNVKKREILKRKCELIINYLNEKTGREGDECFDPTNESIMGFINARFNEGRTVKDLIDVIDKKVEDWLGDEKMVEFLRPSTLFNREKFENYLRKKKPDKFAKYYEKE